jgi:hypothetical protein
VVLAARLQRPAAMTPMRSLTTGLVGSCLPLLMLLVMTQEPAPLAASSTVSPSSSSSSTITVSGTIIDVAPGVTDVASLVRLAPGERVIAVDGAPVVSDLAAGEAIAKLPRGKGRYIDLTVAAEGALRRVLVVMH